MHRGNHVFSDHRRVFTVARVLQADSELRRTPSRRSSQNHSSTHWRENRPGATSFSSPGGRSRSDENWCENSLGCGSIFMASGLLGTGPWITRVNKGKNWKGRGVLPRPSISSSPLQLTATALLFGPHLLSPDPTGGRLNAAPLLGRDR